MFSLEAEVKKCLVRYGVKADISRAGQSIHVIAGDGALDKGYALPLRLGVVLDDYARATEKTAREKLGAVKLGSGIVLDLDKGFVFDSGGQELARLTEREMDVLRFLMKEPKAKTLKSSLLKKVWGYSQELETHTLETHIYRLRQKVEPNPETPVNLITMDDGYRLILG